jgi:hypothetical protein
MDISKYQGLSSKRAKSEPRNPRLPNNLFGGQAKFETNSNFQNLNVLRNPRMFRKFGHLNFRFVSDLDIRISNLRGIYGTSSIDHS